MLRFKNNVDISNITPQTVLAMNIAAWVYWDWDRKDAWVTSVRDGQHSSSSLHYRGDAFDLRIGDTDYDGNRINYWSKSEQDQIVLRLTKALPRDYDVVLESTHIHIEYQPKFWV